MLSEYEALIGAAEVGDTTGRAVRELEALLDRLVFACDPRPEEIEYPAFQSAWPSGDDDATLASTRPFNPLLNLEFLAAHRRNAGRLRALVKD